LVTVRARLWFGKTEFYDSFTLSLYHKKLTCRNRQNKTQTRLAKLDMKVRFTDAGMLFYLECECECVNAIYLLSTIIKAACTINELDSKAPLLHLQLPTN